MTLAAGSCVVVVGDGWVARAIELAIEGCGCSAERVPADGAIDGTFDAAVVVTDELEPLRAAQQADLPCVAVRGEAVNDAALFDALVAGADAVVWDGEGTAAVLDAIGAVIAGSIVCPPQLARLVVAALRRELEANRPRIELTARQRAVLELIARGDSVKQTARTLGIAVKTVENTQSRLYRRLGARNRSQAITVALAERLISPDLVGSRDAAATN